MDICGNIIDIIKKEIFKGCITIKDKKIADIRKDNNIKNTWYILPGFVDAHIHIESSLLIPSKFSILAIKNGTIGVISDPHEIANVLGIKGIKYMIKDAKHSPLKIMFGVPSCVPATPFETSGANLDSKKVKKLLKNKNLHFLAEMMNFPGVIKNDREVISKIQAAKKVNKIIDGHAPGLRGKDLELYIEHGIITDHEAYTYEEAKEKIEKGMYILIREGSAAKNFDALYKLIDEYPDKVLFCTDDSHPDDLSKGHINMLVKKALNKNLDLFNVLRAASYNAKKLYKINIGLLQKEDPADFIIIDNLENMKVLQVYINGNLYYDNGKVFIENKKKKIINRFLASPLKTEMLKIRNKKDKKIRVIKAFDSELITDQIFVEPKILNDEVISDISRDILKIVVVNRYKKFKFSIGFINGFGIKQGAIAQSIAHDSHNIVAVGVSDIDIIRAINKVIENKGGIVVNNGQGKIYDLKLPIGGLMSDEDPEVLTEKYKYLKEQAKKLGTSLKSPFMTLSFMSLLVIPKLKIGDKGLFDVEKFKFVDIFV